MRIASGDASASRREPPRNGPAVAGRACDSSDLWALSPLGAPPPGPAPSVLAGALLPWCGRFRSSLSPPNVMPARAAALPGRPERRGWNSDSVLAIIGPPKPARPPRAGAAEACRPPSCGAETAGAAVLGLPPLPLPAPAPRPAGEERELSRVAR